MVLSNNFQHLFNNAKLNFSSVSFTNNARIYNLEHTEAGTSFPSSWGNLPQLTTKQVSDSFYIFALLSHHDNLRSTPLALSSMGDQSSRLEPTLQERNQYFVGPACPHWGHVCNKCCSGKQTPDGKWGENTF